MTSTLIKITLVTLSIILGGCVAENKADRPETWSKEAVVSQDCPDISGIYKNIGQSHEADFCAMSERGIVPSECVLSVLLEQPWGNLSGYIPASDLAETTVEIGKIDNGIIKVKLLNDGALRHEFMLGGSGRPYECKGGSIYLADHEAEYPTYASIHVWGGFALKPCIDGSLSLNYDFKTAGYIILIPFYGRIQRWYRWERVK